MSENPKKKGCLRKSLGLSVLLALGFWWNFFVSVPLKISPETTLLTEPLTSDGRCVDYVGYFRQNYPPEMKTDRNAARVLVRLLGDFCGSSEMEPETRVRLRKQIFEGLGLEPELKPEFLLISVTAAAESAAESELIPKTAAETFDPSDPVSPILKTDFAEAWVAASSPALDAVVKAIEEAEICRFPVLTTQDGDWVALISLAPLDDLRLLARNLVFRANWRVQQGDFDGALSDALTCRKLGQMLQKDQLALVELLVGLAVERNADGVALAAHPELLPGAKTWHRLQDAWEDGPTAADRDANLLCVLNRLERFMGPDAVQVIALNRNAEARQFLCGTGLLWNFGFDWNVAARRMNEVFDQTILRKTRDYREIARNENSSVWHLLGSLCTRKRRSELAGVLLAGQLIPVPETAETAFQQQEALERLNQIFCAFQLYRLEHDGKLPPAFTRSEPKEGESAKPLHSWRVLLLPYLGETELFAKIRLNEPWNSEWNSQFHAQMPDVFRNGSAVGETNFSVIVGESTLFDGSEEGIDPTRFQAEHPERKVSGMILVTENFNSGNWMKPDAELRSEDFSHQPQLRNPNRKWNVVFLSGRKESQNFETGETFDE